MIIHSNQHVQVKFRTETDDGKSRPISCFCVEVNESHFPEYLYIFKYSKPVYPKSTNLNSFPKPTHEVTRYSISLKNFKFEFDSSEIAQKYFDVFRKREFNVDIQAALPELFL